MAEMGYPSHCSSPTHCAFDNCHKPLSNAPGKRESFCQIHERQFQNHYHVEDCQNNKIDGTQACQEHHNDWHQDKQS